MLNKVIDQHSVDEIIVAMPSASIEKQKEVLARVYKTGFPVKTVTSSEVLISNPSLKNSLKDVDILDLLQRKEIDLDDSEIRKSIHGKSVLVTGAGGSIGSELVRQILKHEPTEITLIDISENGVYALQQEIVRKTREGLINDAIKVNVYIASIREYDSLERIFAQHNFDLVFHAAAHKHVPLMETSPQEAIKNNIFGTKNLIDCCNKFKVERLVNISTDKAVNPTNVMGATKRFIEMMLQSQKNTDTKFVAVRFGNVLGSNGSVVPLFKKQIKNGGPVTVTHPDIVRYFMTIPEAVSLVLQAETFAKGGEIFVLDMGEPVKILDLAENIITLTGYKPYVDIKIEFTGLRPGEKLYEELLMAEEGLMKTENELIFTAKPIVFEQEDIMNKLEILKNVVDSKHDRGEIIEALQTVVTTYTPEDNEIH
ncbi:polysaccharide biosynthesis protein [Erysipelothrix sp. HDW6C]|uniref:polysaccharide biosynthesis protein n=1 Tax=Erysipelothrix sp. HDW6C TaxID=2714930 RepID=UPI00140A306F|nr:nucleoside-diphosphate sugar epimerase/dehydratase [Erysipelothrix sp. HDW6C]QIK70024.1 polysaccharide biosynthesis protein [Erysipelothrix sp. HDW6C]